MSNLTEMEFLERAKAFEVPMDERSKVLKLPKNLADAETRERYLETLSCELLKCVNGDESSLCYLALQPSWRVSTGDYYLAGAEVLVRVKNGSDSAPMPGLSWFQTERKEKALEFLQGQIHWATRCALDLPNIFISVNVRPDELAACAEVILNAARDTGHHQHDGKSNLIFEITEYSPITEEVLKTIQEMKAKGVCFSLDDVSYASPNHACTFQLAREHGHLFAQQKLALPISSKAFNVDVFPTPSFAQGEAHDYFQSERLKVDDEEIKRLKSDVEQWVDDAKTTNADVQLVIEASVHPEDLQNGRSPDIGFLETGFLVQGGHTGGRAFPASMFVEPV